MSGGVFSIHLEGLYGSSSRGFLCFPQSDIPQDSANLPRVGKTCPCFGVFGFKTHCLLKLFDGPSRTLPGPHMGVVASEEECLGRAGVDRLPVIEPALFSRCELYAELASQRLRDLT